MHQNYKLARDRHDEPGSMSGGAKGASLHNYSYFFRRFISIFAFAILFLACSAAANAQSAAQDVSTLDGAKDSAASLVAAPIAESSSLQDPQKPAKDRKPPDQCGVTSAKQCFKDFLNDQKGMWTSPLHI